MAVFRYLFFCLCALLITLQGCTGTRDKGTQQPSSSNSFEDTDPALVVASFNIKWLGDGERDRVKRSTKDIQKIGELIGELQPEVWGLQEIENASALESVLEYCTNVQYQHFVAESGAQRCALLLRSDVQVDSLWEVPEIQVGNGRLRSGLAAKIVYKGRDAVVMSIHFKATSRYDSTASLRARSYTTRARQARTLCNWVQEMRSEVDADVIVLGDFNDSPRDPSTPTLMALDSCEDLLCVTRELDACNPKFHHSIDHVYATSPTFKNDLLGNTSVSQFSLYEAFSARERSKLSDHCPVLVRFEDFGMKQQ